MSWYSTLIFCVLFNSKLLFLKSFFNKNSALTTSEFIITLSLDIILFFLLSIILLLKISLEPSILLNNETNASLIFLLSFFLTYYGSGKIGHIKRSISINEKLNGPYMKTG